MNPGGEASLIPGLPAPWSKESTMAFLTAVGLPADFTYPHRDGGERVVKPTHSHLQGGFGKWLRETPYYRGLFDECHAVLATTTEEYMTADLLAAGVNARRKKCLSGDQITLL